MTLYPIVRPLAFALDAEPAHRLTIRALRLLPAGLPARPDPVLAIQVAGIDFPNPIGLAAGFDKDAEVWRQMLGFGFGFVEVGTLTPRPQPGNPRPRLFRLAEDRAVINRMGFNNGGLDAAKPRLARRRGLVGINVGANKDSADRIADYAAGVREMGPLAAYLAINVSSPNTPGLRSLQDEGALRELLAAVGEARAGDAPVFLKVAPDLEPKALDGVVRSAVDGGVEALIVGNTTLSRPPLRSRQSGEAGGRREKRQRGGEQRARQKVSSSTVDSHIRSPFTFFGQSTQLSIFTIQSGLDMPGAPPQRRSGSLP